MEVLGLALWQICAIGCLLPFLIPFVLFGEVWILILMFSIEFSIWFLLGRFFGWDKPKLKSSK